MRTQTETVWVTNPGKVGRAGGVPGPGREAFPADTRPDTGGGRTRTGDWPALALRGLASVPAPHCGTMSR